MIKSMTGFGRASQTLHGREISVEARAVNHRYLELSVRVPRSLSFLEERLKPHIMRYVSRGKVEIGVLLRETGLRDVTIEPDIEVARGYYLALKEISGQLGVRFDVSASSLARFPDVFRVASGQVDEDELFSDVSAVVEAALREFSAARNAEGERLREDILRRLLTIEEVADFIEEASPEQIERYRDRLRQRMKAVLESAEIDENRILLEAAIYADKSAVDEETVRLKSHINQFREILSSDEPAGRRMDFLTQELNREINTIGSKSADIEITKMVVGAKAELEKIREQIQNIE